MLATDIFYVYIFDIISNFADIITIVTSHYNINMKFQNGAYSTHNVFMKDSYGMQRVCKYCRQSP